MTVVDVNVKVLDVNAAVVELMSVTVLDNYYDSLGCEYANFGC